MEDLKKKVVVKKPVKKQPLIQTNLSRGLFITGFIGMVFFGLIMFNVLAPTPGIPEELFENNIELFQTSVGLFLIGLFSFTKK
jgi:hypothetical protein